MARLSRSKLASYAAKKIADGSPEVAVKEVAAFLIETGRTREIDLVVRAIYEELERSGIVVAEVTSVEPIDAAITAELKKLINAETLVVNETIEPSVLGGVVLRTPSKVLDASFRRRLARLRERKV